MAAPRTTAPRTTEVPPDDWAVGDLAECVCDGWFNRAGAGGQPGPRKGDVHRVRGLGRDNGLFLIFAGFAGAQFAAHAFRKVHPRAEAQLAHQPDEAPFDFRRHLSRPAPVPQSEPEHA